MNRHIKGPLFSKIPLFLMSLFVMSCSAAQVSKFEVQRPARLTIDKKIKIIFIDPSLVQATNDQLGIKSLVLKTLQKSLNKLGRFQVIIGPVRNVDPEKETIAIIQGSVTSKEEIEVGQVTEIATCKGGFAGYAAGVAAVSTSKQGVTFSRRGLICKAGDIKADLIGAGIGGLLALVGAKQRIPPVDEVVRVYKYRNISLFAQVDFSLTMIGKTREVIVLRSDSANFGRHIVLPAINVHESYLSFGEAMQLLISPVAPLYIRRYALVEESNPGHPKGRWYSGIANKGENLTSEEKNKILRQLVEKSLKPFIRTISPYKSLIRAEISNEGDKKARQYVLDGKWKRAQNRLEGLSSKDAADWYHLGLVYEATAVVFDDYQEAKRMYLKAFNKKEMRIFAEGIGRMERRLSDVRKLNRQLAR